MDDTMLWFKKKKEVVVPQRQIENEVVRSISRPDADDIRRKVLDWQDTHTTEIELHLSQRLPTLLGTIDEKLQDISFFDCIFRLQSINNKVVQPLIREWVARESRSLLNQAQGALEPISALVMKLEHDEHAIEPDNSKTHYTDMATAAIGIGSIAAIPALQGLYVVSVGGILGLVGMTTLNARLLLLTVVIFGLLSAFSFYRMGGVKARRMKRYRNHLRQSIEESIVGNDAQGQTSVSQQLQACILKTSKAIIGELKSC